MATPLINLSDDSIFGNSQGDSAPRRGLSTSSQRVNLNDDAMFKTAEEARSTDVQSGKYVSIFDQEAKIEPPKRGIGRMIDDTITSVVGTNKANPEDIRPDGLARVRQEAAQTEQQVGQRRVELGTDDPDRGYAMQTFDSAAAGMANMVGVTMEYAGRQFGIKKMEELGQKAQVDGAALTPKEQDTIQKVFGGVGSALPIVAGGMLAGGGLLAAGAGTGVALAGASAVGAALEAPSIAQEAYEGALKETGNDARAETQGYKAAALNLPISFIMNRIGIFGGGGGRAKQTGKAILAEGTEEGTQKALTNYLGYQPTGEGVSEDAVIGGLTGGVLKQITFRPDAPESKPSQKPAGEETGNLTSEDTSGSPSEPVGDLPEGVQTLGFKEVYQTLKTKPAVAAVLYQEATTPEQKELVKRAVDRAEIQNEFQEALGDANLLNDTRQEMQAFPEFTDSLAFSLTSFVNDMPPANIFKAERRRAPSEQEVNSAFDAAWEDSNYVASLEAEAETIAAEREERQGRRPGFQANTQPNNEMEALVSNAESGFTRPNTTEGMTQTEATEASLPESLRGARVNDGNRVLLEAYFEESLGTILPRNPSKTRTRALAKLQKQMEMVGFPPEQIQVAINTGSFDNASALADVLSPPTQAVSAPVEAPAERVVAPSTPAPATAPSSPAPAAVESFAPNAGTAGSSVQFSEGDGANLFTPEAVMTSGDMTVSRTGASTSVTFANPIKTGDISISGVSVNQERTRFNATSPRSGSVVVLVDDNFLEVDAVEAGKFARISKADGPKPNSAEERAIRRAIGDAAVDAFFSTPKANVQAAVSDVMLGRDISPEVERISQAFGDRFMASPDAGTPDQVAAQTQEQAPEAAEPRVNPEIQRAKDDVFDAAAELADVFADVISVRKNITGQQYTAKDLPPAIAKVMTRLADLGYVKFKDMVRELMKRMRASKDWAPLADQVTPFMLRQAYKKLPKFEGKEVDRDVDSVKGGEVAILISEGREKTEAEETKEAEDEVTTAGMSFTKAEPKKPVKKQAKAERKSDEVDTPAEYGLKERYQLPKGKQASLGLERFQRDDETPQMKTLRGRLEGIVRSATQIKFFEDTILMLQKQITDVESKMRALDTLTVTEGGKTTTFRARNEEDENPGLWATNDMNAYDRFIDGQLPDKPTTKMALMDQRRMLVEELGRVRDKSTASRARLYMRSMSRMMDQMMTVTQNAMSAGMPAEQARAVFGKFYQAISFRDTKPAPEADTVEADQDQDAQVDAFEGAKAAMGIVSDFRNKQITQRQLDDLIDRGVRDGDFTYMDVGDAFRAFNMSVPRGVMDTSSQLSVRKRLKDFMAENGNTTASRMEWMVNMEKVVKSNPGSLGTKFTAEEVAYYNMWKQDREALRSRRKVTDDMREGRTADEAFPNLLFNRFRLSQVRNPDSINEAESTRTAVRAIAGGDPDTVYFEDIAYALRRRPDLEADIFESMTADEGRQFKEWVARKKAAIEQESMMLAKVEAFTTLRNLGHADAILLDSKPVRDEVVQETTAAEVVSPQTLMDEAVIAIESFAAANGIRVFDIKSVEGRSRSGDRGFSNYTFTLKDGRKLQGENLDLFPGISEVSKASDYGIAIPEVMNAALKNDVAKVFDLVARGDKRAKPRTTTRDVPAAPAGGRPNTTPSERERIYTSLVNAELSELPAVMDAIARLNSVLVGRVDPETGEILTDEQAEQYAADFVDSLAQRAMMGSVVSATGAEMSQFGASTGFGADAPAGLKRGEFGFGETVEDAGDAMRASGPQSTTDLTAEEQLQDEMISEADLMEAGREMSEAGTEEDAEGESATAAEQETATEKEAGTRRAAVPGSLVAKQEYRFRRAPFSGELTNSIVAEHVLKIVSKWTGAPRINVVPNVQMLPEGIREQVMSKLSKDSGAAGLFVNGEVYIFSDHISSLSDAEFTLFHETYGHYGMRAFLGAKFDSFLELAYNTNTRIRAEADALMASKPIGKLEAIDEVLSDMAGANEPMGLVKQWLGKVIAGLRQIGMNRVAGWMSAKTDAEIGYTLMMARKAVQEGAPTIFNGAPDEVRLAEARLPYEMFSSRDGNTTAYTRYNPITQTYAVFTATGNDIRKGWNTTIVTEFEDAIALMRKSGKVDRRLRSGLYIDNKIPSDLQKIPEFRIATDDLSLTTAEGLKNYGRLIKRNAIIFFQNEYKAVHEVASYLRSKGRMSDAFDPTRDLEGLHERKTAVKLENLNRRFVKPLLELAGEAGKLGANSDTVNKYLVAKHAEERNNHIAKINKGMPDGGSGMRTKEAKDFLKSIQNEKFMPKLEEISALLKQLSDQKLAMMKEAGLISHDEYMARAQYKNYVNLSGVKEGLDAFDDLAVLAGSSKFSTRKDKRALGRGDMATDVLARTIQSAEAAVLNSSKNRVKQKILAMFEVNYDPDFVSINKQAYKRVLDENGEVTEKMDETYIRNKNVMVVHVNGRPVTIEFKKTGKGTFADAIHGAIYPSEADSTVARALGRYNRIVGQMLTTWNPVWVLVNFVRDAQTLYYNSVADKRVTKQMAKEMVKTIPAAMKATFHYATDGRRGNSADPDMIRAFREMREAGGATSFLNLQGLEKQVSAIEDMINPQKKSDIVKVGQFLADKLEEFNIPIELAPRLAAYKVMRDNGYSRDEAAQYAGEITVNFNMRGSSKFMRNMYLFFNPAVQGSAKLVKLASENPKTFSKIAMGMAAVGFISSVIGRAMGGEDEDGIDKIDKVPVFKRATTLILSPDVPGAAIPVPYGWNAFFAAGVFMADTLWAGAQPAATSAKRIAQSAFEGFSPIGSAGLSSNSNLGTVFKGLSPTAALPLLEIMLNENRFGAPIVKEAGLFGGGKRPNAEMAFDSASPISAGIFKGLNRATGGDYVNPGAIDVNPGIVDHLISSYIPGLVSESYKFASWATKSALGYDTKSASIPLVDRLTAKVPESYDFGMYRRAKEYVATKYDDFKLNPERRDKILADFPGLGGAKGVLDTTDSRIQDLREYRKNVERDESMSREDKVKMINEARAREKEIVTRAVRTLLENSPALKPVLIESE